MKNFLTNANQLRPVQLLLFICTIDVCIKGIGIHWPYSDSHKRNDNSLCVPGAF